MRRGRRTAVLLMAWALFAACDGRADTRAEDDVMAAALEAEIRLALKEAVRAPVMCIEINPGEAPQSPSKEFVARLKHLAPHVVRSGECEVERTGVVDRDTRRHALLLTAGPVEWLGDDDAEVMVTLTRSAGDSLQRRYRVARDAGRWVCLGPVMKSDTD